MSVYEKHGSKYPENAFWIDEEYWKEEILTYLEDQDTDAYKTGVGLQRNGVPAFINDEYRFYVNNLQSNKFANINGEIEKRLPNCKLGYSNTGPFSTYIVVTKLAQNRLDFQTRVIRRCYATCGNKAAGCTIFWLLLFFVFVYLLFDHTKDHGSIFPQFQQFQHPK